MAGSYCGFFCSAIVNCAWQVLAVIEGLAGSVGFGGAKVETMLDAAGQAGEPGLAVGIGAEFQVELSDIHESVGDVHVDFGGIDRRARGVGDGDIGPTGTDAAIDDWNGDRNGVRIGSRGARLRDKKDGSAEQNERHQGAVSQLFLRHSCIDYRNRKKDRCAAGRS